MLGCAPARGTVYLAGKRGIFRYFRVKRGKRQRDCRASAAINLSVVADQSGYGFITLLYAATSPALVRINTRKLRRAVGGTKQIGAGRRPRRRGDHGLQGGS